MINNHSGTNNLHVKSKNYGSPKLGVLLAIFDRFNCYVCVCACVWTEFQILSQNSRFTLNGSLWIWHCRLDYSQSLS